MSQNNNEGAGLAVALGFIVAGVMMIGLFIFAMACFVSFVMTIACLFAWNRPIVIRGELWLAPDEARFFVYRGLAGAILVPAFAVFCVLVFDVFIRADAISYLVIGGYVAGSLGIEILIQQEREQREAANIEIIPPQMPVRSAPPRQVGQQRPPFEYASWDDEEAGR